MASNIKEKINSLKYVSKLLILNINKDYKNLNEKDKLRRLKYLNKLIIDVLNKINKPYVIDKIISDKMNTKKCEKQINENTELLIKAQTNLLRSIEDKYEKCKTKEDYKLLNEDIYLAFLLQDDNIDRGVKKPMKQR